MLEPNERTLLLRALEPPEGYRLDFAIGTTFSLDLLALLTAPLAFTLYDRALDEGTGREQSVELLTSLRRYADRMVLFYQSGRIAFPRVRYPQFAWLERSVVECRKAGGGIFHPKVWVLLYTSESSVVRYRTLCLSRNLTLSSAWDTMLSLDGEVRPDGRLHVDTGPLADFVAALPALALRGVLSEAVQSRVDQISGELRRVEFALPDGCSSLEFRPIGIDGYLGWPFPNDSGRGLVISPFVTVAALERVSRGRSSVSLVSTTDALGELAERPDGYQSFWSLDDDAIADIPDRADDGVTTPSAAEVVELSGLHAKTYVFEKGGEAHVWTGSANCTDAAFYQNVEFLVHLTGPKDRYGVDALMAAREDSVRLIDLLKDSAHIVAHAAPDEVGCGLEARIEDVRNWLTDRQLSAEVLPNGGEYDVVVRTGAAAKGPPAGVSVTCWPVMIGEARAASVVAGFEELRFRRISLEGLSAFFAFRVEAREEDITREALFVLNIPLVGAPADREERLLRSLIGDRARLMRFLTLLLSDDGAVPEMSTGPEGESNGGLSQAEAGTAMSHGLLELLIKALDRAPERLDDIHALLKGLPTAREAEALFPEHFAATWQTIWDARCASVPCKTK
jgi:hypothetical protein